MPRIAPGRLGFTLARTCRTKLENVWNGATQAKHLNKFFTDGAKGDFAANLKAVTWGWKGCGTATLRLIACQPMEYVMWAGRRRE